jgi:DNA invertase Pin-like site-specific DNA recombinase
MGSSQKEKTNKLFFPKSKQVEFTNANTKSRIRRLPSLTETLNNYLKLDRMIYRYLRFSTTKQDEQQQLFAIDNYLSSHGLESDKTYTDRGISGSKSYKERQLFELCQELNEGDTIIVSEVSRITRSGISELYDVINNYFAPNKIKLIICDVGLEVDCSDISPVHEMFLTNLALFAKIEKKLLIGRVRNKLGSIQQEIAEKGGHVTQKGKNKGRVVTKLGSDTWTQEQMERAAQEAKEVRQEKARKNENNQKFYKYLLLYEQKNGRVGANTKLEPFIDELNFVGLKTATGMDFTVPRCRSMLMKVRELYK